MARTPERIRKDDIEAILDAPDIYPFMPVQMGYGKAGLDYHCHIAVRNTAVAFYIEAKKLNGVTTKRQDELIAELRRKKAKVFVIYSWAGVEELRQWVNKMRAYSRS